MTDNNTTDDIEAQAQKQEQQKKLQNQQLIQALQMFGLKPEDVSEMIQSQLDTENQQDKQNRVQQLAEENDLEMNQLGRMEFVIEMLAGELLQHKRNELLTQHDPNDLKVAIASDVMDNRGTAEAVSKSLTADIKTTVEMVAFLNEMFESEGLYEQYNINVPDASEIYDQAREQQK